MIKRIIIASVIYVPLLVIVVLNMHKFENGIFLIPIVSLMFGGFLVREIYLKVKGEFVEKNSTIHFTDTKPSNIENLNKISQRPFLLGLEKKLVSNYTFYFDENYFYVFNNEGKEEKFALTEITEFSRTSLSINKRRIWNIKLKRLNESELSFKFTGNYTIFNKNFKTFYDKLKSVNPAAVKSEWSSWKV